MTNRTAWIWIVSTVLVVVLYVLSIGPVYGGLARSSIAGHDVDAKRRTASAFYYPIHWLRRHSTSVRKAADWYLAFWLPPNLYDW